MTGIDQVSSSIEQLLAALFVVLFFLVIFDGDHDGDSVLSSVAEKGASRILFSLGFVSAFLPESISSRIVWR